MNNKILFKKSVFIIFIFGLNDLLIFFFLFCLFVYLNW